MHHFAAALCAGIVATVLVGAAALTPTPAEAAKTPSAEAVALKEATAKCRAEAKEQKINSWLASRKFVNNCVAKAVKLTPAELQKTAVKQAVIGCKAEAKGKKIRWPASRKFVSSCLSNALKDYELSVDQLRRELVIAGLRWFIPEETGCLQNVYCEEPSEPYIP
jgi:hypothetical protein